MSKRYGSNKRVPVVPVKRPLPQDEEVGEPETRVEGWELSPLGVYCKTNGMSLNSISRAMGVAYKTMQDWVNGRTVPSLAGAYEIERMTKGVVPMEAWLQMPQARKMLAGFRQYQPDAVKGNQSDTGGGGYAMPLKPEPGARRAKK